MEEDGGDGAEVVWHQLVRSTTATTPLRPFAGLCCVSRIRGSSINRRSRGSTLRGMKGEQLFRRMSAREAVTLRNTSAQLLSNY